MSVQGEEAAGVSPRGLVCPAKAAEFDNLHAKAPRKCGRNSAGAKQLAGGYTKGSRFSTVFFFGIVVKLGGVVHMQAL